MKILIKCLPNTYNILKTKKYGNHTGGYHVFNHYNTWKSQGHQVDFVGEEKFKIGWRDYDVLFFRGYNSFRLEEKSAKDLLTQFQGRKILYLEGGYEKNIGDFFDTIFIPEVQWHLDKWKVKYPDKDIRPIAWTCPELKLMDEGDNPYTTSEFKIIYTGIFNTRMLNIFKMLARKNYSIYLGGMYYDDKILRRFTKEEVKSLSINLHLIHKNTIFPFGYQFPFLRHADLALNLYAYNFEGALSSKLTEYLCSGLPVICEDTCPNRNRVIEYEAGMIVKWDDFDSLWMAIETIKQKKIDKQRIMDKARSFHNPEKICKEILND